MAAASNLMAIANVVMANNETTKQLMAKTQRNTSNETWQ